MSKRRVTTGAAGEDHWIESPSEHERYPGESLATRSHDVILQWANDRSAMPATVPDAEADGHFGVLRFDIPSHGTGQSLEHVSWTEWFATFDDRKLVMIFQERLRNGHQSNFFHFCRPDTDPL
jgi:hypothetical protein